MAMFRVLVFGSTGSGKTSLCNALTGQQMPVSDRAKGVTFESYVYAPFEVSGHQFIVTDTVGLNESDKGTVPSGAALKQLVKLLRDSPEGYNLLIHVMRIPRITKTHHDNYEFFVKTITENRVPTILVATGCENVEPMTAWADRNAATFATDGLLYKEVVASCFAEGGRFEESYARLRAESRAAVLTAVFKHGLPEPAKIYEGGAGLVTAIKRAWNWFCHWVGAATWSVIANTAIYELLKRLGLTHDEAEKLAKELE